MDDIQTISGLITGLNGGNVPALDMIYTLTLVALLPTIVIRLTRQIHLSTVSRPMTGRRSSRTVTPTVTASSITVLRFCT